ncbi:MAG: sulfite exporter TauE/SafE family protein [Candidatus Eiseniibacteriota bacterium]
MTHIIQHKSKEIIFLVFLFTFISVIIVHTYQIPLSKDQTLIGIANFLTQNKIILLSLISGAIVGFSLGFIGGGGSILAVPLLLYVVGIENPHVAIGTSALAVSVNAAISLIYHARKRNIRFMNGLAFGIPGVVGTIIGSQLGLLTPPSSLILLFALLMLVMAAKMLVNRPIRKEILGYHEERRRLADFSNLTVPRQFSFLMHHRLKLMGLVVGLAAGYFGIGGGFLIVPSLLHSGLNISNAIGTSLIPVSMFGTTTALWYSFTNQVNIMISILFVIGGVGGGYLGTKMLTKIPVNTVTNIFAIIIAFVGVYIILRFLLV